MKKTVTIGLIMLVVIAGIFIYAALMKTDEITENSVSISIDAPEESSASEQSASADAYIIKSYKEIIGIYKMGEENPFKLINVTVSSLPQKDIEMLNRGITVYSDNELESLIEDFDS